MFAFACPRCHTPLEQVAEDQLACPTDRLTFHREAGIWRMLLPDRQEVYYQFIQEYEVVRRAEGRCSTSQAYYQALPYQDLNKTMAAAWHIRATSFTVFLKRILVPMEQDAGYPLRILDLGAGNAWLSNRLAARGHQVAAVDLTTNDFDGLGCYRFYESSFVSVQAEFDDLPFVDNSIDLVIFNSSLHYAANYEKTLRESLRVLSLGGRMVVLDTPFYWDNNSGVRMVQERQEQFIQMYGFPSNAITSENFLTYQRLADLSANLDLDYKVLTPFYGPGWMIRLMKARLLGRREPAKFHLVVFQPASSK